MVTVETTRIIILKKLHPPTNKHTCAFNFPVPFSHWILRISPNNINSSSLGTDIPCLHYEMQKEISTVGGVIAQSCFEPSHSRLLRVASAGRHTIQFQNTLYTFWHTKRNFRLTSEFILKFLSRIQMEFLYSWLKSISFCEEFEPAIALGGCSFFRASIRQEGTLYTDLNVNVTPVKLNLLAPELFF